MSARAVRLLEYVTRTWIGEDMRALATLTMLLISTSALGGASGPAVETSADGSVRVLLGGDEYIASLGLVFPGLTRAAPGRPGRNPAVAVGESSYEITALRQAVSGGTIADFSAAPLGPRHENVWTEYAPVRVRLEMRLGSAMNGGALVMDGETLVSLSGRDAAPKSVLDGSAISAARCIEFMPRLDGERLFIEFESPLDIKLARRDGSVFLTIGETVFEPKRPIRVAAWFGSSAFAGEPVFVSRPEASFNPGLGCFEIAVRGIGIPGPASVGSTSGGAGFVARRFEAAGDKVEPRGWPEYALRLPAEIGGRTIAVRLRSRGLEAYRDVALPGVNPRRFLPRFGSLSGPSFAFSADSIETVARLAEAEIAAARLEVETGEGGIDAELAWRIDRLLEKAGEKGVAIRMAVASGGGRGSTADTVSRACARWSAARAWAGLELPVAAFDGAEHVGRAAELAAALDRRNRLAVLVKPGQLDMLAGLPVTPAVELGSPAFERSAEGGYAVMDVPPGTDPTALWRAAIAGWQGVFFRRSEALEVSRFLSARPATGPLDETLLFDDLEFSAFVARGARGAMWHLTALAPVVEDVEFSVEGIVPGDYRIEWWDPSTGRIQTSYVVRSLGGGVPLRLSGFAGAVAGRLVPAGPSMR